MTSNANSKTKSTTKIEAHVILLLSVSSRLLMLMGMQLK